MEVGMRRIARSSIWLIVLVAALPERVRGDEVKAGIATVVEGDVTTRRASLPQPVPLKFRDDVLRRDTIVTAERSLARLLLGGKATVTVRERSLLTVTEVPGTSLVELGAGKIGLAVVRERMQPGDVVEIRTHNAIIAVRGTVVIAEIVPAATNGASARAPVLQSNIYVMTGKVEAQELRNGMPVGPVYPVGRRQMITISPLGPPQVTSFPESRVASITAGLQPSSKGAGGPVGQSAAKEAALRAAVSDLLDGPLVGENHLPADGQFVRAPIVPTLPRLSDAPVIPPAPLTQPPALGPSPVQPPTPVTPRVPVAPGPPTAVLAGPNPSTPSLGVRDSASSNPSGPTAPALRILDVPSLRLVPPQPAPQPPK